MKITMIHGQNHKGSTYHIGRLLADKIAQENEFEIEEFFLPKDLNHFCRGCYTCIEDETKCPFYEEKHIIETSIEEADILIFTTPAYCMRASAPMKSFIDLTFTYWMSHRPRSCMFSKKAVVISTAAGKGTGHAVKDITDCLFYWGVPYIKSYGISVQAMNWEGVSDKKKLKIEKDIAKLARKLTAAGIPRVGLKTKIMFNFMRMMQKSGLGSSPVETQYWEENGWLSGKRPWKNK